MAFVAHGVADVVKQRSGFEEHARFCGKMMHRLQLIEKLQTKFANMFGMAAIAVKTAGEDTSAAEQFTSMAVVAMRLFAGENFASNVAKQSFANSDTRNRERVQIEVAAEREKNKAGDAHDVGAIATHAIDFHSRFNVAAQQIG